MFLTTTTFWGRLGSKSRQVAIQQEIWTQHIHQVQISYGTASHTLEEGKVYGPSSLPFRLVQWFPLHSAHVQRECSFSVVLICWWKKQELIVPDVAHKPHLGFQELLGKVSQARIDSQVMIFGKCGDLVTNHNIGKIFTYPLLHDLQFVTFSQSQFLGLYNNTANFIYEVGTSGMLRSCSEAKLWHCQLPSLSGCCCRVHCKAFGHPPSEY